MRIVALVGDLLFESKIRATAAALGLAVETRRSLNPAELPPDTSGLIVDLGSAESDGLELIRALQQRQPPVHLIAFLPHVQVELARQARAAGADEVLSRSAFTDALPQILSRLAQNG